MQKSVSNQAIRAILATCQQQGGDADTILMASGLTPFDLARSNGRIPAQNHYRFLCQMQSFLNGLNEAMFFYDIEDIHEYYPTLIGLCLNQPTARAALDTFLTYRVVIGSCDDFHVTAGALTTQYEYINQGPPVLGPTQAIPNFVIVYKILRMYLPTVAVTVGLVGKPAQHHRLLDQFFGTHCCWEQPSNTFAISNRLLDTRSECFNPLLNRLQILQLDHLCSEIDAGASFASVVGDRICHKIRGGVMDSDDNLLNDVCSAMHISRWTLNRKLQVEGTSFSTILKHVKMMEALRLLEDKNRQLQDISEMIGFSSQSAFNRFFKTNANMTPLAHRKTACKQSPKQLDTKQLDTTQINED